MGTMPIKKTYYKGTAAVRAWEQKCGGKSD
jgi:hypothetical protein